MRYGGSAVSLRQVVVAGVYMTHRVMQIMEMVGEIALVKALDRVLLRQMIKGDASDPVVWIGVA